MKNIFMVFTYLVSLTNKLLRLGGMKALIAENLILKQQLLLITRSRKRAPDLSPVGLEFIIMPRVEAERGHDSASPAGNERAPMASPLTRRGLRPIFGQYCQLIAMETQQGQSASDQLPFFMPM